MHALHEYVAKQFSEKLRARKTVVCYDPRREFPGFFAELGLDATLHAGIQRLMIGDFSVAVTAFAGSFFETRHVVEPLVASDDPEPLLVYVPGVPRDTQGSVLMELELAGECYEPQLKRLARNVLRTKLTDGVIDDLLERDGVTYADLARALDGAGGSEAPSLLRGIYHDVQGTDGLLARWLALPDRDAEIEAKGCRTELRQLITHRLRFDPSAEASVAKLRAITARFVLCAEFRSDLKCDPPSSLTAVPAPTSQDVMNAVRELTRRLRSDFADGYADLADSVEQELRLPSSGVPAIALGSIDTFRYEERALLEACGDMIADGRFEEAVGLVAGRERCFWLDRDLARRAQWEACRHMAELGTTARAVAAQVAKAGGDADAWVEAYTAPGGWHRLDHAQRRLESLLTTLDEEPAERPLLRVREAYDDACRAMATGFTRALANGGWEMKRALHQTRVHSEVVIGRPRPVAYVLVDAMRFEMAVELVGRLPKGAETNLRAAAAALPSITPVGMGALMPGAAGSYSVTEQGGKLGSLVDGAFLPDLTARKKHAAARIPQLVDISLDELLSLTGSKLTKKLAKADVVVVRSQEIDQVGEAGMAHQARRAMDGVIDNLARALRKLATAGVINSVITADHGHLFHAADAPESMRIDAPGGETIELHRRAWIGRGGATPSGCVRVAASALGYASDLDFVFPEGLGVFRAGGDLAFHHGGTSLQEMVIPVLTVRMPASAKAETAPVPVRIHDEPGAVTNRIFSVILELEKSLFADPVAVRPLPITEGRQVGTVLVAHDAEFDQATGCVILQPGTRATVAFLLRDDSVKSLRIVVQDPTTDAELARSASDIPVRLSI